MSVADFADYNSTEEVSDYCCQSTAFHSSPFPLYITPLKRYRIIAAGSNVAMSVNCYYNSTEEVSDYCCLESFRHRQLERAITPLKRYRIIATRRVAGNHIVRKL